jgi:hypothetical protein
VVAFIGSFILWRPVLIDNNVSVTWIFRLIVLFNWIQVAYSIAFPILFFRLFGGREYHKEGTHIEAFLGSYFFGKVNTESWAECIRVFLCKCRCRDGGMNLQEEDFLRIANLMRKAFEDMRGWVLTDIAAGIALVKGEIPYSDRQALTIFNSAHKKFQSKMLKEVEVKLDDSENVSDQFVNDLVRYSTYFVGAYGAGMYCLMRPWECCFLCSCQHKAQNMEGDDCCATSQNAFLRRTGCNHTNLLYANFQVDFA